MAEILASAALLAALLAASIAAYAIRRSRVAYLRTSAVKEIANLRAEVAELAHQVDRLHALAKRVNARNVMADARAKARELKAGDDERQPSLAGLGPDAAMLVSRLNRRTAS